MFGEESQLVAIGNYLSSLSNIPRAHDIYPNHELIHCWGPHLKYQSISLCNQLISISKPDGLVVF
jgi:hypothetical protein